MKYLYLAISIIGAALPFSQFIPWLRVIGFDIPLFIMEIQSSRLSSFAWLDVAITAFVLAIFIIADGRKSKIGICPAALLGTFLIGPSFGLPFYLFAKEVKLGKVAK